MKKVYLDHQSATPILPEALEAMLPFLKNNFGNPSSLHEYGEIAKQAVEDSRLKIASLISAQPNEIIFTSTGSEANNFALKSLAKANETKGRHIITSQIEHFSVLHPLRTLERAGFEITRVPVDKYGQIEPKEIEKSLRKDTILVSIMHANNEIGTIQPISEIANILKERKILFHTDAVSTGGVIHIDVNELGVDAMTISSTSFYGPKGAAVLYLRKGTRILPYIEGGFQEEGKRAGTENVPSIVGMGKAAEIAKSKMNFWTEKVLPLRNLTKRLIQERIDDITFNGHPTNSLPGLLNFCIHYIEGESVLLLLNMQGISASSGSSCTSKALKASHVLTAIGVPPEIAQGSLLLTFGKDNTEEDVLYFVDSLPPIVERLRKMSPLYKR